MQSRKQHKKGNQLLGQMEELFSGFSEDSSKGAIGLTENKDLNLQGMPKRVLHEDPSITTQFNHYAVGKDEAPELPAYNMGAMIDLDLAVQKRLTNGKAAISKSLQQAEKEHGTVIPEYFEDTVDVRRPADDYVVSKLDQIIEELFEGRLKLEKNLGRGELLAYDRVLSQYLTQDVLIAKLKRELQDDQNMLSHVGEAKLHLDDSHGSESMQEQKTVNLQRDFNREVVNEDALYKLLAY